MKNINKLNFEKFNKKVNTHLMIKII